MGIQRLEGVGVQGVAHKSSAATMGVSSFTERMIRMRLPLVLKLRCQIEMRKMAAKAQHKSDTQRLTKAAGAHHRLYL